MVLCEDRQVMFVDSNDRVPVAHEVEPPFRLLENPGCGREVLAPAVVLYQEAKSSGRGVEKQQQNKHNCLVSHVHEKFYKLI